MPNANAARVGWSNLADTAGISASSFAQLTPPTLLQNPHVARKWRAPAGDTAHLTIDLLGARLLDCVALMGLNLTAAGLTRIRASLLDTSAVDGAVYDSDPSGQIAGRVSSRYPALIHLLPTTVTARYLRIDLSEPGAAYVEAGRLFAGATEQFAFNFAYGWNRGWTDRSRTTESRGGQTYVDRDNSYRTLDLTFETLSPGQRYGLVEDIDQFNGKHTDVLIITDPTSDALGRDSIWGLLEDVTPVSQPFHDSFAKTYRIKERL